MVTAINNGWIMLHGHIIVSGYKVRKISNPEWILPLWAGVLWGPLTVGRGGLCKCVHEGGNNPSSDLLSPRGHTLFRRMQTPRLMDDRSDCFPGFIFTREIVIHPLREAEGGPGPLFCSALIFFWIQDAMKSLRAQLPLQGLKERWSKSSATAVPSPNSAVLCWAEV